MCGRMKLRTAVAQSDLPQYIANGYHADGPSDRGGAKKYGYSTSNAKPASNDCVKIISLAPRQHRARNREAWANSSEDAKRRSTVN